MSIELRVHQVGATPAVVDYLRKHKGKKNPIVALPTGAGKSYCIADFVRWAHRNKKKVLILSHVWEIIDQNVKSIEKFTGFEVGVYSAKAGRHEIKPITGASIQSIYKKPELVSGFDYIIVDECHRISYDENSMYRKLASVTNCPWIGYTATYYRLGTGYIFGSNPDQLFDDVVHDWTSKEKFNELVKLGYLSPLVAQGVRAKMDTSNIKITGGDFNLKDLSDNFDREEVTDAILKECMIAAGDRKQWLFFAIDMKHADHIAEWLNRNGKKTIVVHSKMEEYGFDRDKIISDIKDFKYDAIVNVDILTTGFDHPAIDFIGILRPTESPVLHVQMDGRGSRTFPGKLDCLILDFAGNHERLGPINDPVIKVKGKGKEGGEPPMKQCPECDLMVLAQARKCSRCGHVFPRDHGLTPSAYNAAIIDSGEPVWVKVDDVTYERKAEFGRPATLVVTYHCGDRKIKEHICLEHKGFARDKARHWIKYRGGNPTDTVAEFMPQTEVLKKASRIRVVKTGKYFNITESLF
ncbi:DEAD/DEAH box helicase family protein [Klebsiella pneumoniae]|nr:DEAD/DEAH box helicase family protein [Klebsiella pneumoniae]